MLGGWALAGNLPLHHPVPAHVVNTVALGSLHLHRLHFLFPNGRPHPAGRHGGRHRAHAAHARRRQAAIHLAAGHAPSPIKTVTLHDIKPRQGTYGHDATIQVDSTGILDLSKGTGTNTATRYGAGYDGTALVLGGSSNNQGTTMTGSGIVANGVTYNAGTSTWTPVLYGSVVVDGGNESSSGTGTHISPGTGTSGALTIGTLTTGNQMWIGNGNNTPSYRFDIGSVTGTPVQTAGVGADLLNINGALTINSSSGGGRFTVQVDGGTTSAATGWLSGNNYKWTIAQTTAGITGTGVASLAAVNTAAFTTNGNAIASGGAKGFGLVQEGNNLNLYYVGTPNAATYTATSTTGTLRFMAGTNSTSAPIAVTFTNTGSLTGFNDFLNCNVGTLTYSAGGAGNPTNATPIGYGASWTNSTTYSTNGSNTLGLVTITPTVQNSNGGSASLQGSVTGISLYIVAKRTFSTPTVQNLGDVLLNGTKAVTSTAMNFTTSGDHSVTTDVTFGATNLTNPDGVTLTGASSTFNTNLTTSGSRTLGGTLHVGNTYGAYSNSQVITSTGENLTNEGTYAINFGYTANVGIATVVGTKAAPTGTTLTSAVVRWRPVPRLGLEDLGHRRRHESRRRGGLGSNAPGRQVGRRRDRRHAMAQTRTAAEMAVGGSGGGLVSDVVNLSDPNNDAVVVQMSYSNAELARIWGITDATPGINTSGAIALDYLSGSTWVAAGTTWKGNMAAPTDADVSSEVGWSGIDLTNGVVWAVVNHGGELAAVPEPGTIVMLLTGVLALVGFALRRRSKT